MGSGTWTSVSLCLRSSELNCSQITTALGMVPSVCHEKGERMSRRNPASRRRDETLWVLKSEVDESLSLEETSSLAAVAAREQAARDRQLVRQGECRVVLRLCGREVDRGDFRLSHAVWAACLS